MASATRTKKATIVHVIGGTLCVLGKLNSTTLVQSKSFSETRGGSSDTSPQIPECNPSRSDLSRSPDRGCYRRESRHHQGCSAKDSISFSASRNVTAFTKTTFCSSGVGSKKSKNSGMNSMLV